MRRIPVMAASATPRTREWACRGGLLTRRGATLVSAAILALAAWGSIGLGSASATTAGTLSIITAGGQLPGVTQDAFDPNTGDLYVVSQGPCVVDKLTPYGQLSVVAGTGACGPATPGPATSSELNAPVGVAFDSTTGDIYIADTGDDTVDEVTPSGQLSIVAGEEGESGLPTPGPATSSKLGYIDTMAVDDATGAFYIADIGAYVVEEVNASGQLSIVAGVPGEFGPATPGPAASSELNLAYGVAVDDATGDVYIPDQDDAALLEVTPAGQLSVVAGILGTGGVPTPGPASASHLQLPTGVAVDQANGNIYVADDDLVEEITAAGQLSVVAGNGTEGSAVPGPATSSPIPAYGAYQIAVDSTTGNFYIAGEFYADILEVTGLPAPTPVPQAVASTAGLTFAAPVGQSAPAQTVTITSDGTPSLAIGSVTLASGETSDFSISDDTCAGATLPENATCTMKVGFKPTAAGLRSSTLEVASNDPNSPVKIQLSGDGAPPGSPPQLVTPVFSSQASADRTIGGSVSDTATLADGNGPSGTVTFKLYGPNDASCSGAPLSTSTATVSGNGNYKSASFTPTQVGVYRWIASYGGDTYNALVSGSCGGLNESVTLFAPSKFPVVEVGAGSVLLGDSVSVKPVTVGCGAGATIVGGGFRTGSSDGLVDQGVFPSNTSGTAAGDGGSDPSFWTARPGFSADPVSTSTASGFVVCVTGGPTGTRVVTAKVKGPTRAGKIISATAVCSSGSTLVGGGGATTGASSVKLIGSFPSNRKGVPAANRASSPVGWTAVGAAGSAGKAGDRTIAYAVCASGAPETIVASKDLAGRPHARSSTALATIKCPAGTRLIGGGGSANGPNGGAPQDGVSLHGSYPSTTSGSALASGAADPAAWSAIAQAGSKAAPGTSTHVWALCAEPS